MMDDKSDVKHILCAVRSRPGGEETVNRAIELALATNARLTFCQIINTSFVNRHSTRGSARKAAYRELTDMAQFALSLIRDQAERRGVTKVNTIVRTGNVRQELLRLTTETNADLLVLGRPQRSPRSMFDQKALEKFVAELEETGVKVDY